MSSYYRFQTMCGDQSFYQYVVVVAPSLDEAERKLVEHTRLTMGRTFMPNYIGIMADGMLENYRQVKEDLYVQKF